MSEASSSRVVVITGASSGMGRAVAVELARRGDRVVVAARREGLLRDVVRECEAAGGQASAFVCDVTDEQAVEEVARHAESAFGPIAVWIHPAATATFGKIGDVPLDAAHRTVDVILGGTINVCHVALRRFRRRGEGTLVVVASTLGKTPIPYLGYYNAAKYGVVGLTETLRTELQMDGLADRIRVSTVLPPSTDTPFYIHAANFVGRVPRPPPPVYGVQTLAREIVEASYDPKPEVVVGAIGKLMVMSHKVAPGVYDRMTGPYSRGMFLDRSAPQGNGALFEPMREGRTADGGWKDGTMLAKRVETQP